MVEGLGQFTAKAFASTPPGYLRESSSTPPQPLSSSVETWLIEPLKAPSFSVPDLQGKTHALRSYQGTYVLLNFWASRNTSWKKELQLLNANRSALSARELQILALNVDDAADVEAARSAAGEEAFRFPVLFATEEVSGIYNIMYRHLFDRRRDLGLPTSFLLDKSGMIVKVYQGMLDPKQVLEDVKAVPATPA